MTYARPAHGFATVTTRLLDALGTARLRAATGAALTWLRRCANPVTGDSLSLDRAVAADIAAAAAGLGTPFLDEYRRQLAEAGATSAPATVTARARLARRIAAVADQLDAAGTLLAAAVAEAGPGLPATPGLDLAGEAA